MYTVYVVCMVIGFLVPLLSVVFHLFDGFVDFVTFDVLDLQIGDVDIDFLPLSVNAVCIAALLFGGLNLVFLSEPVVIRHIVTGLIAYAAAVLLQALIHFLKKQHFYAETQNDCFKRTCYVTNQIRENGFGEINCKEPGQSDISFPARSIDGSMIKQNTLVEIKRFEDHVAIVQAK